MTVDSGLLWGGGGTLYTFTLTTMVMLVMVVMAQITSGHAVFDAEVEKEIECRSHHDEPVRFFCDECELCVCVLCTFHAHRGHRVLSFRDAASGQRQAVLELLERCRRRGDHVDQLMQTLTACNQLVTDTEQAIHHTAAAFIQVHSSLALLSSCRGLPDMNGHYFATFSA